MKHLLCFLLATICCLLSINAQNPSIINGVWERGRPETIRLFAIENGVLHELASSRVGANGEFALAFFPQKEGFFAIGERGLRADDRHTFYFKPGDYLNVRITQSGFELFGENTPENMEMERWHYFVQPMEIMSDLRRSISVMGDFSSSVDFFPLLVEKEAELKNFPKANTPNEKFNSIFERYKEVDFLSLAVRFTMFSQIHPQSDAFPDFYRNISIKDLTRDEFLLDFPNGINVLSNVIILKTRLRGESEQIRDINFLTNYPGIKNPVIQGEWILNFAHHNQTRADLNAFQQRYGHYLVTDSQRERMRALEIVLFQNETAVEGERVKAFDFTFPDVDGNQVSLSDFKGKVVYIDVWATWCGPCIAEKPALRNLKTEFNDRDIVFMSVSIDSQRDKEKWREFLVAQNLSGVQLFAGDDAERGIMQPYGIRGIPHFILVGKDGKIILSNAPRPSSPQIRAVLNDALSR